MPAATEKTIQAVLMDWSMNTKQHQFVVPNATDFLSWEADLISITRARMVHEYEIKLTAADYRRDALKDKHRRMVNYMTGRAPDYFWYVTYHFDIEPPEHAGWMVVERDDDDAWRVVVKRDAPRLRRSNPAVSDKLLVDVAHLLSWRLTNHYGRHYSDIHETRRAAGLGRELRAARRERDGAWRALDRAQERIAELERDLAACQRVALGEGWQTPTAQGE